MRTRSGCSARNDGSSRTWLGRVAWSWDDRVRLDLDEPARVEQRGHDCGRGRGGGAENLEVRSPHADDVTGIRDEDARPDHVLRRGVELGERGGDDLQAAAGLSV